MKICWDNLEGLRYVGDGRWYKGTSAYVYKEKCEECHKEAHKIPGCGYGEIRMEVCIE